jgi:hypothetical protein
MILLTHPGYVGAQCPDPKISATAGDGVVEVQGDVIGGSYKVAKVTRSKLMTVTRTAKKRQINFVEMATEHLRPSNPRGLDVT